MARRELSREELFALVWEKPTREIGKDLGLSSPAPILTQSPFHASKSRRYRFFARGQPSAPIHTQLINVGRNRGRHSELKGAVAGLRQDGSPAMYDKKG